MAFAALAIALVLAGAGEAHATAFSIEGETAMRYSGTLTFSTEIAEVTCEVTLRILMEHGIEAIEATESGKVTEFASRSCRTSTGRFRALTVLGLPIEQRHWVLGYKSFLGTLPNATGFRFRLEDVAMLVEVEVLGTESCLYEGLIEILIASEREGLGRLRTTSESAESVEARLLRTLAGICPTRARMLASLTPTTRTRVSEIAGGRSPSYVTYSPRPVEIPNGSNSLNATLRNDYTIRSVTSVAIENETGTPVRYQARIGTCLPELTYGPGTTMCRIEVERTERNVRGLGAIKVRFLYGYFIDSRETTAVEVNGLGTGP
jgi:hypothetical protein